MDAVKINKLTVNLAGREIFRDLSWSIDERARSGLVGPNGAGKSTLLKAIAGSVTPDAGAIKLTRRVTVRYMPQEVDLTPGRTLYEEASTLPPALAEVEADLARVEASLADPDVYGDEVALARALRKQERFLEKYEALGGPAHTNNVRAYLTQLGFSPEDDDLLTEALSGGQKKLVWLVRMAVERPDVLLLDEPDNHLDIDGKRALETFIKNYDGGIVIVSHDRYLLDEIATEIAEIEDGKITVYVGNYTAYLNEREIRRLRQQQMYAAQQKRITQIEEAIARFEMWAKVHQSERAARQAASRRKMLERMAENGEIIEEVKERRLMTLEMNGWRGSTKALEIENLAVAFDDDLLFYDLNLLVWHGERVGIIGPNGIGKSVLFRVILGQLEPLEGKVKIGPSMKIGYYAQEHQTLQRWWDKTPVDMVRDLVPRSEGDAIGHLITQYAFTYDHTRQPIRTLSGGERSRLQIAALILREPNLLLLDEPTNNLDIQSIEVLENALDDFEGAILTVSHDRYFLDRIVDRVHAFEDGTLSRGHHGGYTDWDENREKMA